MIFFQRRKQVVGQLGIEHSLLYDPKDFEKLALLPRSGFPELHGE